MASSLNDSHTENGTNGSRLHSEDLSESLSSVSPGSPPLRVLHLVGSTRDVGGILSVLRNLHEQGARVGVHNIVLNHHTYRETRSPHLEYRYSRYLLDESPSHLKLLFHAILALPELLRLTRQERFDIVHGHSRGSLFLGLFWSRVTKRPFLFTNHTYGRRKGLYRWAARQPRIYTVLLTPNMARHYGLPLQSDRIDLVPACCAPRFFEQPLRRNHRRQIPIRLIGLGTVERWKRWHLVVEALGRLPPSLRRRLRFDHYGPVVPTPSSQSYARELQAQIQALDLHEQCVFHGMRSDVIPLLQESDLFVLPSVNEPCSVALSEAMALGLPAVVSRSGGNVDTVQHGKTGLLFEPDQVEDFARQLAAIAERSVPFLSPTQIRESVRDRHAAVVAERYVQIYRKILADFHKTSV